MKNYKNIALILVSFLMVTACTHKKVSVTQVDDQTKSCTQIASEIAQMEELENDIDGKTGLSGRNVGMALLFWPGIIVNEMNAEDARDRASDRKANLIRIYNDKSCS